MSPGRPAWMKHGIRLILGAGCQRAGLRGILTYVAHLSYQYGFSAAGISAGAAALVLLSIGTDGVAADGTSASYTIALDDSIIGGGGSGSASAQLSGSVVTMLNKRSLAASSSLVSGFTGVLKAVPNRQPVLSALSLITGIDTPVTGVLQAVDPDGEPMLFGTGTPLPGTMQAFAPGTGSFTWLPPAGLAGVYSLPVSVTDGFGPAVIGSVTVTVLASQIVVSPAGTLITTESGGQSALAISLLVPPSGTITVPISSSRPGEVLTSPTSLTFTPQDWSNARTVTLTGQPDGVTDGNQTCQILIGPSVGPGTNYNGTSATPVTVVNLDQDQTALVITESALATVVAEAGTVDSYTVALAARPSGTVTVTMAADPQLRLGLTSLTFTTATWNTPQTVTVAAVDDLLNQGNRTVFIIHAANGGGYSSMPSRTLPVSIIDNDSAALVLSPSSVTVSESGTSAQVLISLASQPGSTVTVAATSNDTAVATTAPAALSFSPGSWNVPQAFTVTGVDDGNVASGNRSFSVSLSASGDAGYAGISASISGLCLDNDSKNLLIATSGSLQVTEGSAQTASYTLRLSQVPSAPVTVTLANPDGYVVVSPLTVDFTSANWMTPQTVTVRAVDDAIAQGPHQATITHAWTSLDPGYVSSVSLSVAIPVGDNDIAGIAVTPNTGLITTEIGGTAVFGVRLLSQPLADVIIPLVSGDSAQATPGPASLTFTNSTWNQPQNVVVTGRDGNAYDDGDVPFAILVGTATSADAHYAGVSGATVTGINRAVDNPPTIDPPLTADVGGTVASLVTLGTERTLVVNEDPGTISMVLTGISNGQAGETQVVTVTASSDTVALTGIPTVTYLNPQSVGQLRITPVLHANGTAWITVSVADGGSQAPAVARFKLVVNAVDTPPTVDRVTVAVVAYHGAVPLAGLQANALAPAQLACSDVETAADQLSLSLTVPPQKGVLQLWMPSSGSWSNLGLSDSFTQQAVDLGYVRYLHTDTTGALNDGLQFVVRDSGNQTAGGAMSIVIDPNKPSGDLLPAAAITFREGDAPIAVAEAATLFNPVATLSGGNLTIGVSRGDGADTLSLQPGGNVSLTGANVFFGATGIGTIGSPGPTLVVTFNAAATTAMAEEVLRRVEFANASENPAATQRIIAATLTNSLGFISAPATRFLTVIPVNDPPTARVAAVLAVAGIPVSGLPVLADVDGPTFVVTVAAAPVKGELTIRDATTGAFTYRAFAGQSGPDAFVLSISDGATPVPGVITLAVPVSITGPATLIRPWIYSRPPVEALAGDVLQWRILVDTQDLANPQLTYAVGDAPAGLQLIPDPVSHSADVSWTLPGTLSGEVSFTVLVADQDSGSAAAQTVTLVVHPRPGAAQ